MMKLLILIGLVVCCHGDGCQRLPQEVINSRSNNFVDLSINLLKVYYTGDLDVIQLSDKRLNGQQMNHNYDILLNDTVFGGLSSVKRTAGKNSFLSTTDNTTSTTYLITDLTLNNFTIATVAQYLPINFHSPSEIGRFKLSAPEISFNLFLELSPDDTSFSYCQIELDKPIKGWTVEYFEEPDSTSWVENNIDYIVKDCLNRFKDYIDSYGWMEETE